MRDKIVYTREQVFDSVEHILGYEEGYDAIMYGGVTANITDDELETIVCKHIKGFIEYGNINLETHCSEFKYDLEDAIYTYFYNMREDEKGRV